MFTLKPQFLDYKATESGPFKSLFNFSKLWKSRMFLLLCVALIPLVTLACFNYIVTKYDTEKEIHLRTARLVSNTKRTVSFFLEERKAALAFIVHSNSLNTIKDREQLANILSSLKASIGGFTNLEIIDSTGKQVSYQGPALRNTGEYSQDAWFKEVVKGGYFIGDINLLENKSAEIVIAIKCIIDAEIFYILRATLDTEQFNRLLYQLDLIGKGDAFLISKYGVIQTPSLSHGKVHEKIKLPIPEYSNHTKVHEVVDRNGKKIVIGYAYIPKSPFILMITEEKSVLMKPWRKTQNITIFFIVLAILCILVVVYGVATHLVGQIFLADLKRAQTLHEVEQSSKFASIGRLAAGVAHEVNNPLAIINEKAGLIKDIFSFKEEYKHETKIITLIDSIITSVDRCGRITKRLLGFARNLDINIQKVTVRAVIEDVLSFLTKEAEYRSISVNVKIEENIPEFETDRGKLQQVLLNIVNNAFAAMEDNGQLDIYVRRTQNDTVSISIKDNGSGIPEENIRKIFEPFFSTKTKTGGTGLGLSITYGLIQELHGKLDVTSEPGVGTEFSIILPLTDDDTTKE